MIFGVFVGSDGRVEMSDIAMNLRRREQNESALAQLVSQLVELLAKLFVICL